MELPEMEKISILVKINGQTTVLTKDGVLVWVNDQLVSPEYEIRDGDKVRTQVPDEQGFIVADVLRLFDIDMHKVKSYKLLKMEKEWALQTHSQLEMKSHSILFLKRWKILQPNNKI